jgi:non-ribosomal peptide synthetase component F
LEGVAADQKARISDLPLLSEAERHQLGWEWNDGSLAELAPVHRLFERQVERTPEALAVVFQDESLSYAELNARADALASHLRELGAGPEGRVGLFMERSIELPVAVLGIWKSGAAYVPLDPGLPEERLAFQRRDAGLTAVVTQEMVRDLVTAGGTPALPGKEGDSNDHRDQDSRPQQAERAEQKAEMGQEGQPDRNRYGEPLRQPLPGEGSCDQRAGSPCGGGQDGQGQQVRGQERGRSQHAQ